VSDTRTSQERVERAPLVGLDRRGDLPPDPAPRQHPHPARHVVPVLMATLLTLALVSAVAVVGLLPGVLLVGAVAGALPLLHRYHLSPRLSSWGASPRELRSDLDGDDVIAGSPSTTTRAVTIDAPVEQVWPVLMETVLGQAADRPDRVVDGLGPERIVPEVACLGAGRATGAIQLFEVHRIAAPHDVVAVGSLGSTWCLRLDDVGLGRSRLVSRFRASPDSVAATQEPAVEEVGAFLMERRALVGIKGRAEAGGAVALGPDGPCAP
jgi:hypothetical protein